MTFLDCVLGYLGLDVLQEGFLAGFSASRGLNRHTPIIEGNRQFRYGFLPDSFFVNLVVGLFIDCFVH